MVCLLNDTTKLFIVYLFEHKKKDSLIVNILHTQSQLADYLNVTRPALSKEINKMIKEELIAGEGKRIANFTTHLYQINFRIISIFAAITYI